MLPEIYINKVLFEQGQLRRKTFVVILPRRQPIWQVHPVNPILRAKRKARRKIGLRSATTDGLLPVSETPSCGDAAAPPHVSGQNENRVHPQKLPGPCASYGR